MKDLENLRAELKPQATKMRLVKSGTVLHKAAKLWCKDNPHAFNQVFLHREWGNGHQHCLSFQCDPLLRPGLKQIRDPRLDVFSSAGKNTQEGEMRMTYESSTSISNERKDSWSLIVAMKADIPLLSESGLEISGEVSSEQRARIQKVVPAWHQGHLITKTFYDEATKQYDHRVHISGTVVMD